MQTTMDDRLAGVGLGENWDVRIHGVTFAIFFFTPSDEQVVGLKTLTHTTTPSKRVSSQPFHEVPVQWTVPEHTTYTAMTREVSGNGLWHWQGLSFGSSLYQPKSSICISRTDLTFPVHNFFSKSSKPWHTFYTLDIVSHHSGYQDLQSHFVYRVG